MSKRKKKISTFNAVCFALAAFLFSYSILSESPEVLAQNTRAMVGSVVGATASVEQNADNTLAAEFAQKEKELTNREEALLAKESANGWKSDLSVYSLLLSLVLFVALGIN